MNARTQGQLWADQFERERVGSTARSVRRLVIGADGIESGVHYAQRLAAESGLLGEGPRLADGATLVDGLYHCGLKDCPACAALASGTAVEYIGREPGQEG